MVCGEFGLSSLAPYGKGISLFNALLSLICAILGVIGCVSYTLKEGAIRVAPWSVLDLGYTATGGNPPVALGSDGMHTYMYGGLKGGQTFVAVPGEKDFHAEAPVAYADCKTPITADSAVGTIYYPFCDACDKSSAAIVSMCSLALIAAFVAFFCHLLRSSCDSVFAKDMSVLAGATSFIFGVIALIVGLPCKSAFEDWIDTPVTGVAAVADYFKLDYSFGFGNGAKVTVAAFAMILIITILSLFTPVAPAADAEAVPTKEEPKV